MKSLTTSTALHAVLLTWGLWSLSSPEKLEMGGEAVPVTLVADVSQSMIGDEKAPQTDTPAPQPTKTPAKLPMPAEHVGDNEVDLPTPPAPKAAPRETVKTKVDDAPPPPPPPAVKPPEPKPPEPKPPEPKPTPPVPAEPEDDSDEADSAPEIDPLAAEIAKAEAEKPPAPPAPPKNVPAPQAKPKPPEPVKVAEAKPDPKPEPVKEKTPEKPKTTDKAKPNEAAKDKSKETSKPGKHTSQNDPLEDAVLAALKNTQESAGGGAKRSTQQASLGGKTQTGGQLSQSDKDALLSQLRGCWSIPGGVMDAQALRVSVQFSLDPSGKLLRRPTVESSSGNRTFDESAVRAIMKCDNQGFALPAGKQSEWAEIIIDFNPSEMF